ncbi:hypothetical protein IWX90DRAFT_505415 [Phyllosticta citrichinensis]|uniref:Uncharacterized protein n=1 Tax=Phyllosticta citrichinensis TaxID=1130410 RepID=A0ABR1XRN7_9PEZI
MTTGGKSLQTSRTRMRRLSDIRMMPTCHHRVRDFLSRKFLSTRQYTLQSRCAPSSSHLLRQHPLPLPLPLTSSLPGSQQGIQPAQTRERSSELQPATSLALFDNKSSTIAKSTIDSPSGDRHGLVAARNVFLKSEAVASQLTLCSCLLLLPTEGAPQSVFDTPPTHHQRLFSIYHGEAADPNTMGDIQQWMRKTMMQPTRSRTPSLVPPTPSDLPLRNAVDGRSTTSASDSSTPMTSGLWSARAATGGAGPRKKISSYFSGNPINTVSRVSSMRSSPSSKAPTPEDAYAWDFDDDDLDTTVIGGGSGDGLALETALDAIYHTLCQNPFEGLPVGMNKSLLALVEWCRKTAVEKEQQEERIEALTEKLRETEKRGHEEMAVYKAEIKRLELIIANGHNGMSRLMASRQDSVLGRRGNRRRTGDGQRLEKLTGDGRHPRAKTEGDGAPIPVISPWSKEALLSRHLSLIGPREIFVGTPPQGQAENHLGSHSPPLDNVPGLDSEGRDFSRIKEIATAVCIHRGLKPERVLPTLVAFFDNADERIGADSNERKAPDSGGEKPNANATRPPSWAPGDDATVQGEARASTESRDDSDRRRRPRQTCEVSQARRGSVTSDLSISSSEETGAKDEGHSVRAPIKTKIPSPCPEVGFGAHRRQGDRSPGVDSGSPTMMGRRPESSGSSEMVPLLSSSVSSHRTAFRRSSDRFDYYGSSGAAATRTAGRHANQSAQKAMADSRPASKSFSGGGYPLAAAASDTVKSKARISPRSAARTTSGSGGHNVTAVTKQKANVKENEAGTTGAIGGSHNRGTAVGCGEKKKIARAESSRDVVVERRASQAQASSSRRMAQQQQREK